MSQIEGGTPHPNVTITVPMGMSYTGGLWNGSTWGNPTWQPGTPGFTNRTAHIMSDPTVVSHCCFCGSGDIVGGNDQTVSCTFCNRTFVIMEQPKFNSMPVAPGATTDATMPTADPGAVDPATGAPIDPAAAGVPDAAPQHAPTNPQTDPEALAKAAPFKLGSKRQFRTASGVSLVEDDFIKHVAFLHDRDYLVG